MPETKKTYSLTHVKSMWRKEDKDKNNEIVGCMNDLRPELQEILDLELSRGNLVLDASRDFPNPGSVFIQLRQSFLEKHEVTAPVAYGETNDRHYWKAHYTCGKPLHTLASSW